MDSPDAARHLRQGLDDSMAAMARGSDCSMDFEGVSKGPWIGALWDDLRKLIHAKGQQTWSVESSQDGAQENFSDNFH